MIARALLGLVLAACTTARETGPLSAPALMKHVGVLADPRLDGRLAGTPGEREAARYVARQLHAAGLEPSEQAVPIFLGSSTNVHALLAGKTNEVIVIGAHIDHLGLRGGELYPGADDNASGVALVLGIAQTLATRRAELGRSVLFVLFGAEEQGLLGSSYFVECAVSANRQKRCDAPVALSRIVGMVNLDMIGRPIHDERSQGWYRPLLRLVGIDRDGAVGLIGTRHFPALRTLADAAFAAEGGEIVAAEDLPDEIEQLAESQSDQRSDSFPFEQHHIPALFFGDAESEDYHRPTDTIDRLDPALLARHARAVARVVLALSNAPRAAFDRSEAVPPKRKPRSGWYLPLGFSTALSIHSKAGYVYGGEASLVHLSTDSLGYAGVYADALRVGATDTMRISVGPEIGRRWLGLDAGYVMELDHGNVVHRGAVIRPFASLSVLSIGVRLGYLHDEGAFAELGLLVKVPLALHTRSMP